MKRLLCIVGSMDVGGAETFLMKIYRKINKENYQMDFCVAKQDKNFYEDEIMSLGGKIYRIIPKYKNTLKNFHDIKKVVKENNYKYVLRISQHSLSALELLAAKLGGAKVLCFRSSNTSGGGGKISSLIHYLFRPILNKIAKIKIAPSTEAATYMFGKNIVKKGKYTLIKNGLDIEKFKYSKQKREEIRKKLNLTDKFVVGHVGRFSGQKNHKFLLEVFKEVLNKKNNSILLLIGKGELKDEIKEYARRLGIIDKIIFYGISDATNDLYCAMDYFVFPSLYEGMPNAILEAQTSGLQCLVSDNVTKECDVTELVTFKSLDESANEWSKVIVNDKEVDRMQYAVSMKDNGYDINDVIKKFEKTIFIEENNY